ncbi:MAG TPA: nicotinate-nicotinamide nucleotide adenylyltransferase, partial [bacterium]|nr:nicotinate-nicotinamide nucleotide adenylyltransferase [bacterium]
LCPTLCRRGASERGGVRNRVAIFGGSFNPPHRGHTEICRWIFDRGLADEVIVVPCFIHPFSKSLEKFEHRLAMLHLALSPLPFPIRVSDIEREMGGVSITLRTIERLKKRDPDSRFLLVAGSDIRGDISKWHQFERIRGEVEIIEIPRGSESRIPNISSTDVREKIRSGRRFHEDLEKAVAMYIITHGLYRE